jgi:hypothetical protein
VLTIQSSTLSGSTCGAAGSGGPFVTATTIVATTQPSGIALGSCYTYTLTGTDSVGNVSSIKTTVRVPGVAVFSVSRTFAARGAGVVATITGKGFQNLATVSFSDPQISASGVTFISSTQLSFTLNVSLGAALGARSITVTNPDLSFATGTESFYWSSANGNAMGHADLDGANVNNSLFGVTTPGGPAVWGPYIYYPSQTNIRRANLDGTGATTIVSGLSQPDKVAVNGNNIFWADGGTNQVGRANLDGSGVVASLVGPTEGGVFGVAIDSSFVYWTNSNTGHIGRANLDGTSPVQNFVTGAGTAGAGASGVAVNGTNIYWSNASAGTIGRANIDGSSPNNSFITGANFPNGVAVDATSIYWANFLGTSIGQAPLSGTPVDQNFFTGASQSKGPAIVPALTILAAPAVTAASPSSAARGATLNVTISGSGFEPGAALTFSGAGITVNSTTFVSAGIYTANVTVAAGAATGSRTITVTNPDGSTVTSAGVLTIT